MMIHSSLNLWIAIARLHGGIVGRHGYPSPRHIVWPEFLIVCLALAFVSASPADANDRTELDQQGYLLLDPRLVDSGERVSVRLGKVTKYSDNPLFKEEKPWEVRYDNVYANVIYDQNAKLFKCFYSPFIVDECTSNTPLQERANEKYHVIPGREMGLCYAYSEDGFHWTKPELGIVEWNGNNRNNLLMRSIHGAGVIFQPTESDPTKRFKLLAGSEVPGQERFMIVAFSADGIHWTKPVPCPEIESTGDTHNNAIWSSDFDRFVGFTREFLDQRLVVRTESPDFVRWTKAVEVLRGDQQSQTYAMQVFPCRGIYLGMLAMLNTQSDRVEGELAVSADTVYWQRICPGVPLVANSNHPGDYDYGCVYVAKSPIAVGDDVRIYYGASNAPHGGWREGSLALATMKRDRWAGYENSSVKTEHADASARITTVPIVCRGSKLRVNALVSNGLVRVGVVGQSELTIDACNPITGDFIDAEVQWNSGEDLSHLVGKPIQLKFQLENGILYAFEFAE